MAEPFIGQIIQVGFTFAPRGWALCQGQILPIQQYSALFALLGTTYGGNGQTTFALPDLRGRKMIHHGNGPGLTPRVLGETGGSETVTLLATEMASHNHSATFTNTSTINATTANATLAGPASGSILATGVDVDVSPDAVPKIYAAPGSTPTVALAQIPQANVAGAVTTGVAGGSQPHSNLAPYLALNFIIALQGIFPSRN